MADEWTETTIGEQATLQRGIDITKTQQRTGSVPVISSGGISSYHDTPAAKGPGVVLGRKGVVGSVYFVESDYWPHDTTLWVKDFHGNHPRFVYYFFRHLAPQLASMDVGSANPTLNRNHVHPIETAWPPLQEQKAIAKLLGTVDDKIELNRQMNQTLEGIARALFKSWFVDLDSVRAKAEGGEPALHRRLAEPPPYSFDTIEDREVPKGWTVLGLDKTGRFLNGLALQKFPPQADRFLPVIKIAQLRTEDTSDADKASADLTPEYIVEDGDVLFSWSGSLECVLWAGGRGALNQHLFKVTSDTYPKWFYYLWIHAHLPEFRLIASGKATTMGHIQRGHLSAAKVLVPPPELLKEMDRFLAPLIDRIINLKLASRTLAAIRDALLPQLISGELRVSDAERIVGGQA